MSVRYLSTVNSELGSPPVSPIFGIEARWAALVIKIALNGRLAYHRDHYPAGQRL